MKSPREVVANHLAEVRQHINNVDDMGRPVDYGYCGQEESDLYVKRALLIELLDEIDKGKSTAGTSDITY